MLLDFWHFFQPFFLKNILETKERCEFYWFSFSCCCSSWEQQNCWELFLRESWRKLRNQSAKGEFSTTLIYIFHLSILGTRFQLAQLAQPGNPGNGNPTQGKNDEKDKSNGSKSNKTGWLKPCTLKHIGATFKVKWLLEKFLCAHYAAFAFLKFC